MKTGLTLKDPLKGQGKQSLREKLEIQSKSTLGIDFHLKFIFISSLFINGCLVFYSSKMDLIAGTVCFLGTVYSYCSLNCLDKKIGAAVQGLPSVCCNCSTAGSVDTTVTVPIQARDRTENLRTGTSSTHLTCVNLQQAGASNQAAICDQRPADRSTRKRTATIPRQIAGPKSKVTKCVADCPHTTACRPGKITKNAFFNFVREIRVQRCGYQQTVIVQEAARKWRAMTCLEKSRYNRAQAVKGRK